MAPSLKFASAKVSKVSRSGADSGASRPSGRGSSGGGSESDPWATEGPGGYSGTPPFQPSAMESCRRFLDRHDSITPECRRYALPS